MTEEEFDEMVKGMDGLDEVDETGISLRDTLPLLKRMFGCPRTKEEEEKLRELDAVHEAARKTW